MKIKSDNCEYSRVPRFDRQKQGIEIQTIGFASDGSPVHAGVHWVPEISARYLWRLHHNWLRWRRWYDNLKENRKRNYPAKQNATVAFYCAHPIDNPREYHTLKAA